MTGLRPDSFVDGLALIALAVLGLAAGVTSTLLGVGGGLIMVPVLHYVGGIPFREATALSLLAIALQSPMGVWQHAKRGAVDWRLAVPLSIAGVAGVLLGAYLQPRLPVAVLKLVFAAVMAIAAWRLTRPLPAPKDGARPRWPALAGIGLAAGLLGKLLGIGGGLVTVPVLALLGVAVHTAVGTSLVSVFTNAALASGQALAAGLDWLRAVPMAVGALVGSPIGARLAHALPPKGLRTVMAGGLVLAAAWIAYTALA